MNVLKRYRLSHEKLNRLGIKLGLSRVSFVVIDEYVHLLMKVCECLALPEDHYMQALNVVRLREILSLWLRMVDHCEGATWVALDNALYEVDKETAMSIRRERKPSLTLVLYYYFSLEERNFEMKHFRSKTCGCGH